MLVAWSLGPRLDEPLNALQVLRWVGDTQLIRGFSFSATESTGLKTSPYTNFVEDRFIASVSIFRYTLAVSIDPPFFLAVIHWHINKANTNHTILVYINILTSL